MGLVGVTELSDAQKKQLKEQQEVRPGGGEAGSTAAGSGLSPHTVQWSQGQRNSFWAGSPPVNDMPTPEGPPQPAAGPKAQACSRWPVIPRGWCPTATLYGARGPFPLSSFCLSFLFSFLQSSPGQAWLALGAPSSVAVLGIVGVRASSASPLLP